MTREQGTGNREEVLGNFTFSYIFRFFTFTYLYLVLIINYHEKIFMALITQITSRCYLNNLKTKV
ncbi:MAG: hypothetical protein ACK471_06070 [Dolichospermum sp.]